MQVICVYHSSFLQNLKDKKEQKKFNQIEEIATRINKNPQLRKMAIFTLGSLLYCQQALAAPTANVAKINQAGNTILDICRTIGYWSCIVMCVNNIIKELLQGDTRCIARIMTKYALAFSSFYLLPWILDIIKEIFQ